MLPRLSIVIPARDEASRIERGFSRLEPVLEQFGTEHVEVIIVDDGSSDDTGLVAARVYGALPHSLVVRREENRGKGAALRLGFAVARAPAVIACDADMAIDPSAIPPALGALESSDLAFGSRAADGAIHYDSWVRTRAGAVFNALVRHYVDTDLRDTQCGFKAYRLGAARLLANLGLVDGFAFDVEILHLAGLLGLGVVSVPVTWDDVAGSSVQLFADSRRMLRDIRRLRTRDYSAVVVRAPVAVDAADAGEACRASRLQGVLIARGPSDALVVLPRDAAVAGVGVAAALGGTLGVAKLDELRDRMLEAI